MADKSDYAVCRDFFDWFEREDETLLPGYGKVIPREALLNRQVVPNDLKCYDLSHTELLGIVQEVKRRLEEVEVHFARKVAEHALSYQKSAGAWLEKVSKMVEKAGLDSSELCFHSQAQAKRVVELEETVVDLLRTIEEKAEEASGHRPSRFEGPLIRPDKPIVTPPAESILGVIHTSERPVRQVKRESGLPPFPEIDIETVGELGRDTPAALGDFENDLLEGPPDSSVSPGSDSLYEEEEDPPEIDSEIDPGGEGEPVNLVDEMEIPF